MKLVMFVVVLLAASSSLRAQSAAVAGAALGLGTGFLAGRVMADFGFGDRPVYIGAAIGQGAFAGLVTARFRRNR